MNATLIRDDVKAVLPGRPRSLRAVGVALVALLIAAVAAFVFTRTPADAAQQIAVPQPMRDRIVQMSTGANQSLIVSGETAQQRNALIPLAGDPLAHMAALEVVPASSAQYGTALKCLTQAVYYEAANEPDLGKRAVAQVVINRMRHPAYPKSVCGVVYEGANAAVCQFSFTCDGALLRSPMPRQWAQASEVARAALAGSVVPQVGSATNYHADYVLPRWAFTLGKIGQIGAHIFYRFPGSFGGAGVFNGHWAGLERIPALDLGRLRLAAAAADVEEVPEALEVALVPNLTVTPDVKDRHAEADVGGRLDTNTGWRLSIPDPVQLSASYRDAVAEQSGQAGLAVAEAKIEGQARTPN